MSKVVKVSRADILAAVLLAESVKHFWDGVECRCSCGVVPPVVDRLHAFDAHCAEAGADALLASGALVDATKLAEDEALVERMRANLPYYPPTATTLKTYLEALAAALSAQSERAEVER